MRRNVSLLPIALLVSLLPAANAQEPRPESRTFTSAGKQIRIERFAPAAPGKHPAVIMLYGASGMTGGGDKLRGYARQLSDHGYVAFLLHYFDSTDSPNAGEVPVPEARFRIWTRTLEDAISFVGKDASVERNRIGLLGFSLGAFLAVWESTQDARVRAVVEYYGGTSMFLGPPKRMPATLILHGEKDSFVSVKQAYDLERLLQQEHAAYEIKVYPGLDHGFDGPDGDPTAAKDAWERTLGFFSKRLAH